MKKPLMILGTSSGAGKSLMVTAICRLLKNQGEIVLPFKGQNMSNNAWVDKNGCEMAYSQAVQAWAAELEPICSMNPILLKPKGDSISEVIHLGKSVGMTRAKEYYKDWFNSGWEAIQKGLEDLKAIYPDGRLILEGAGSPVEINLMKRDLTNLRLAKYLNANCILVADIERGGVFAQLIGTLALLKSDERELIKGIIINRFRGDASLFETGRKWLEEETHIPILGIMPWLDELFPQEDSLDLLERNHHKTSAEIEIVAIRLPSISNFSDLEPLEAESTVRIRWVYPGDALGEPDAVIIPGSKQTLKDLEKLTSSGLGNQIKDYAQNGGYVFGICGGLQILGEKLIDPMNIESESNENSKIGTTGLGLLPINTTFLQKKSCLNRKVLTYWPTKSLVEGFELHHGRTQINQNDRTQLIDFSEDRSLGWVKINDKAGIIAGTYLHGIFENGEWRRVWINKIREKKDLPSIPISIKNHSLKRDIVINRLTDSFKENIDLSPII